VAQKSEKPWGGRFAAATHPLVEQFTESISFDHHLAPYDIAGSCAHAEMLAHIGILKKSEAATIVKGLRSIEKDLEAGTLVFSTELEDIHMNIETELRTRIGAVAGKLHTGRSRNDQVALDERLMLRDILSQLTGQLCALQAALVTLADSNQTLVIPGFTHLQYAMPVLVAHHLLSYVEAFDRDRQRLVDQYKRVNILPLGSAALAGSGFPLDRSFTAEKLGFDGVARNSMDAVADRDYLLEFLSTAAIIGMHLSRLAEDFILWASQPFGFIDIADAFCTGSSLMPNKKNPDVLELVRGKCGRLYGNLVTLLTVMKGLPMTYNRDLQEDKEPVFDSSYTVTTCLEIMAELVPSITFRPDALAEAAGDDFLYATDWADYLVKKGIPFREAHELVGRAVGRAVKKKCGISALSFADLKAISSAFDEGILEICSADSSVKAKSSFGSTYPANVKRELRRWKRILKNAMM
jgi:argininosuccinate lyase